MGKKDGTNEKMRKCGGNVLVPYPCVIRPVVIRTPAAQHAALSVLQFLRKMTRADFAVLPVFDRITRHTLKNEGA